jgi:GntR family transcriptional regulator / MocR family aminotransferase
MTSSWSTSASGVFLTLDRSRPISLGRQLQEEIRRAIRDGRLAAGDTLPASRQLAQDLGISRGIVQSGYEQLTAEGFLIAVAGSGTRVASTASPPAQEEAPPPSPASAEIDFSPGRPDLGSFPVRDWMWALNQAARIAPTSSFGYPDPSGVEDLRLTLTAYLARVRGVATTSADLVVCSGFTQGAALSLSVLRELGVHSVGIEDPGHPDQTRLVERASMDSVPVPVDESGLDVATLDRSGAGAVILTPAHQTPTGVVLTAARRQALAEWSARTGGYVIEDDYDAEFRYDKKPVGSVQPLAPGRVISLGSVSKSLSPALRLGWIVAPRHLAAAIAMQKEAADHGSPALDQLALSVLMRSGRFDQHLRRMRRVYSRRRAVLVEALAEHARGVTLWGLQAGFHGVAYLAADLNESEVIARAAERSVRLHGLDRYRRRPRPARPGIVFGFGDTPEESIRRGIATIGHLLTPHDRLE